MSTKKTNVIFILADQHNAKVLSCKGDPNVKTPNLDKMASQGVRFDNAITQNPICTPSRVSWLSGQYCHNHGYYGLNGRNSEGLPNILGHFKSAGYATSAVGKIHCPEYWVEDVADNFHDTCGCSIGGRSKKYTQFLRACGKENLEDHAALPNIKGSRHSMEGCPSQLTFEESQEGWIVSETIEFIEKMQKNNTPFFAHVSFPRPHQCTAPSEPFWSMYDESKLVLPPNADYDMKDKAPHMLQTAKSWRQGNWTLFEPKTFEAGRLRKLHGYLGAISQVDHAVGEIIKTVEKLGISENTIIIYSSDHGDYACEHGIMEKAPGICSDAITRIPMIWKWDGHFNEGHIVKDIVETVDLSQTLCFLCGLDKMETSDGCNIAPLLKGEKKEIHKVGVTEFAWSKSLRKGDYRLVYYPPQMFEKEYPEGFGELYNLKEDPWEMKNLYFVEDYQNIKLELEKELLNWLITTTRPGTVLGANSCVKVDSEQVIKRYNCFTNPDGKINPELLKKIAPANYL